MAFFGAFSLALDIGSAVGSAFGYVDATAFGLSVPEPSSEDEHSEGDTTPACTVQRPLEGGHLVRFEQPLNGRRQHAKQGEKRSDEGRGEGRERGEEPREEGGDALAPSRCGLRCGCGCAIVGLSGESSVDLFRSICDGVFGVTLGGLELVRVVALGLVAQ
jgi:hypothetical protein